MIPLPCEDERIQKQWAVIAELLVQRARNPRHAKEDLYLPFKIAVAHTFARYQGHLSMPVGYGVPSRALNGDHPEHKVILDTLTRVGGGVAPIIREGGARMHLMSGAQKFEVIYGRPDYYVRDAEPRILKDPAYLPTLKTYYDKAIILEFGVGNGEKLGLLLQVLQDIDCRPHKIYRIDIARDNLIASRKPLEEAGFSLKDSPEILGNFLEEAFYKLPFWREILTQNHSIIVNILGATIGNLQPDEIRFLLKACHEKLRPSADLDMEGIANLLLKRRRPSQAPVLKLRGADGILIGMDHTQSINELRLCYDDPIYAHFFVDEYLFTMELVREIFRDRVLMANLSKIQGEVFVPDIAYEDIPYDKLAFKPVFDVERTGRVEMMVDDGTRQWCAGFMDKWTGTNWAKAYASPQGFFHMPEEIVFTGANFPNPDINYSLVHLAR